MQIKFNRKTTAFLVLAMGLSAVFISSLFTGTSDTREKPVFFDRMPTSVKKIRQHINISIDYEKLPARNEIRLIGRVNTSELPSQVLSYKWTLKNNLKLKRGQLTGTINLKQSQEITLDVAIVDMKKKVDVRLEANAQNMPVRITGVQSFIFDPSNEDLYEAQRMEIQSKAMSSHLTKEEALERELRENQKSKFRQ